LVRQLVVSRWQFDLKIEKTPSLLPGRGTLKNKRASTSVGDQKLWEQKGVGRVGVADLGKVEFFVYEIKARLFG